MLFAASAESQFSTFSFLVSGLLLCLSAIGTLTFSAVDQLKMVEFFVSLSSVSVVTAK